MARVTVVADEAAVAATGAARVTALANAAIEQRGGANVCLTGGSTPKRMYELLAAAPIDWQHVPLYWGDERQVPPHHADSNYGMAAKALVSRVSVPASQIHRMRGEMADGEAAAHEYEAHVTGVTFDVMLLGLGEDGHIASLFPGSDPIYGSYQGVESTHHRGLTPLVVATQPRLPPFVPRITLTPAAILNSRDILMLVAGAKKASAVEAGLKLPEDVSRWPVQLLRAAGDRVEWLMDATAGRSAAS
jgi:6-phosphogluconolactonase